MLDFLRSEGIDEEMLARIEDFRRSFPAAPENAGRIPCPKYKYYGCEDYKDCKFMTWDVPTDELCPNCGKTLFKRRGGLIVCNNEGCGYERVAEKKPRGRKKAEKTDE